MKKLIYILMLLLACSKISATVKYVINCKDDLLKLSHEILLKQVGVREATGNNDGEMVEAYLASVGLKSGNPYCAAGQYWCFSKSAEILRLNSAEIPLYRTGSTILMFNKAVERGRKVAYKANVDDLIFWRKKEAYRGHVERVIKLKEAGWVETVGFNTSSGLRGSQDDGNGVFIRKRNIYHPIGRMVVRGLIGFDVSNN